MKALLLLLALALNVFAAPKEKDIGPLITSAPWKYNHSTTLNLEVRFYRDGKAVSKNWRGVWKQTGPRTIEVTDHEKRKSLFTFNEAFTGYNSVHFDGEKIAGTRVGEVPSGLK